MGHPLPSDGKTGNIFSFLSYTTYGYIVLGDFDKTEPHANEGKGGNVDRKAISKPGTMNSMEANPLFSKPAYTSKETNSSDKGRFDLLAGVHFVVVIIVETIRAKFILFSLLFVFL